jgi:hypothetical protein
LNDHHRDLLALREDDRNGKVFIRIVVVLADEKFLADELFAGPGGHGPDFLVDLAENSGSVIQGGGQGRGAKKARDSFPPSHPDAAPAFNERHGRFPYFSRIVGRSAKAVNSFPFAWQKAIAGTFIAIDYDGQGERTWCVKEKRL